MKTFFALMMISAITILIMSCSEVDETLENNNCGVISLKALKGKNKKGTIPLSALPEVLAIRVFATTDNTVYYPYIGMYDNADTVFYIKKDGAKWKTYRDKDCNEEFVLREPSDENIKRLVFVSMYNHHNTIINWEIGDTQIDWTTYPIDIHFNVGDPKQDDVIVGTGEWVRNENSNGVSILYEHIFTQITCSVHNKSVDTITINRIYIRNIYATDYIIKHGNSQWLNSYSFTADITFFDGEATFAANQTTPVLFPKDFQTVGETVDGLPHLIIPSSLNEYPPFRIEIHYKKNSDPTTITKKDTLTTIGGGTELLQGKVYNINLMFN